MNNSLTVSARSDEQQFHCRAQTSSAARVVEFYEEAGTDYLHWSKGFNMHLGFYRRGANPFRREAMLEQMNLEIAERLRINRKSRPLLIDLGCGTGAASRTMAKNYSGATFKGVTVSASQVAVAARLNERENLHHRIEILAGDYAHLPFADKAADGVWAIESACYADGAGKENLIREMARVLKPDGRFVVADCFVKQPDKEFNFLAEKCYRAVCDGWALTEMARLENFVAALEKNGFREIVVEDVSWRIVPSLCHAPFKVFSFVIKKLLSGERLKPQSVNNLKASLLAFVLGMNRSKISYCLISGSRK